MEVYKDNIFILEKYHPEKGGYAFATAPFFVQDEDANMLMISQIRDANFSYIAEEGDTLYMRLYTLKKSSVQKYININLDGPHLFKKILGKLVEQLGKKRRYSCDNGDYNPLIDDIQFRLNFDVKLIINFTYCVSSEPDTSIQLNRSSQLSIPSSINFTSREWKKSGQYYMYHPIICINKKKLS